MDKNGMLFHDLKYMKSDFAKILECIDVLEAKYSIIMKDLEKNNDKFKLECQELKREICNLKYEEQSNKERYQSEINNFSLLNSTLLERINQLEKENVHLKNSIRQIESKESKKIIELESDINKKYEEILERISKKLTYIHEKNGEQCNKVSLEENIDSNIYLDIDYFDFENHFRGKREFVKLAQKQYLKYFIGKNRVVDIGCGRGEFLELLKEEGINAIGIDTYPHYIEYCKLKGLNAIKNDAIEYLKKVDSVDGIFASQLIEHLSTEQLIELCKISYDKLEDGAYLVMETPNPTSLAIYTNAFYIDPSHNKPIHPLTIQYFLEKSGFSNVEIIYTEKSRIPKKIPELQAEEIKNLDEFNKSMKEIEQMLYGSQDYAVIACK